MLKLRYHDYPEYTARITAHYAGDMVVIEEIGELSGEAVDIIKRALGIERYEFELTAEDLLLLPLEKLPEKDRKLLLEAVKTLDGDTKLKIMWRPEVRI